MIALARLSLLMLALRSVLVPIVAVALNLFTVAATFGVLTLLFTGSDPLLGGPGYIDAMSIIAIFTATFGLSIAYEATVVPIDALLIRPVVLPAAVELLGRRAWWPTRAPSPTRGGPGTAAPSVRPPSPPRIGPTPVNP